MCNFGLDFKPDPMHKLLIITFVLLLNSCFTAKAQYTSTKDTAQYISLHSLDLKLNYQPVQLEISSAEISKNTRALFVYSQQGMFDQYHALQNKTTHLKPYKAHYPNGLINCVGNNRIRDSFNPHGCDNIGSALINGFLNGIILGNKY